MSCPAEEELAAYAAVHLPPARAEAVEAHLDECASCRRAVAAAAAEDDAAPAAGASVGRYRLLGCAGRGGMGVVYAAWDPELDRKVAVKLLRPEQLGENGSEGRARLQREAQALARLSHPNVVAAFDVGVRGDELFLAMEFVEGETLAEWLARERRPWRVVLDAFLQAGAGLAAAHRAGLLHRDFKPSNVLVGADGRIRVTDFGLARAAGAGAPSVSGAVSVNSTVTQTGAVLGTPAYMAPEQARGESDPRSDQYSFSVALYEALYGERPSSEVERPHKRVPLAVHRVVRRGLAEDPRARFPDLASQLAALERAAVRARWERRAPAGAAALAVVAAAAWALQPRPCANTGERLADVWNESTARAVEDAFRATNAPFAADASAQVRRTVDSWAERWNVSRLDACEATRIRDEQSETVMDLRVACLERGRARLGALAAAWRTADVRAVEKAVDGASSLPPPQYCDDVAALQARVPPPADPAVRAQVEALAGTVARLAAARETGHVDDALPELESALAGADRLGWAPLRAELLQIRGRMENDGGKFAEAEKTLQAALVAAEAGGDDRLAAELWSELVWVVGYQLSRFDEGAEDASHARALLTRIGGDDLLDAALSEHEGVVAWRQGRYAEAETAHRHALDLRRRALPADDPRIAQSLTNLGIVANALGRREEAARFQREGLAVQEKSLGAKHPAVARTLSNLGSVYYADQRYEDALAVQTRSLEILVATKGPDHPIVASAHNNVGSDLLSLGRFDAAREHFARSLEIKRKAYGDAAPALASSYANLAELDRKQGRFGEAATQYRQALRIWEDSLGEKHPLVAVALTGVGETLVDDGRAREAVAPLERACAIRKDAPDPLDRGQSEFALARALWDVGDHTRARRLAEGARAAYASVEAGKDEAGEVEGWLKTHAAPGG